MFTKRHGLASREGRANTLGATSIETTTEPPVAEPLLKVQERVAAAESRAGRQGGPQERLQGAARRESTLSRAWAYPTVSTPLTKEGTKLQLIILIMPCGTVSKLLGVHLAKHATEGSVFCTIPGLRNLTLHEGTIPLPDTLSIEAKPTEECP